jgi:hypothetical protein
MEDTENKVPEAVNNVKREGSGGGRDGASRNDRRNFQNHGQRRDGQPREGQQSREGQPRRDFLSTTPQNREPRPQQNRDAQQHRPPQQNQNRPPQQNREGQPPQNRDGQPNRDGQQNRPPNRTGTWQNYSGGQHQARIRKPAEETIDDIKGDITRLEKEIQLEILEIKGLKLGI